MSLRRQRYAIAITAFRRTKRETLEKKDQGNPQLYLSLKIGKREGSKVRYNTHYSFSFVSWTNNGNQDILAYRQMNQRMNIHKNTSCYTQRAWCRVRTPKRPPSPQHTHDMDGCLATPYIYIGTCIVYVDLSATDDPLRLSTCKELKRSAVRRVADAGWYGDAQIIPRSFQNLCCPT